MELNASIYDGNIFYSTLSILNFPNIYECFSLWIIYLEWVSAF
jgi:hypothetical protein